MPLSLPNSRKKMSRPAENLLLFFMSSLVIGAVIGVSHTVFDLHGWVGVAVDSLLASFATCFFVVFLVHKHRAATIDSIVAKLESISEPRRSKRSKATAYSPESLDAALKEIAERFSRSELAAKNARNLEIRFLRTVSEDIRTPLLHIMSGVRDLKRGAKSLAEKELLDSLQASAFRLLGSINDALELGRPSMDESSDIRSIDFTQLAADLSELYSEQLEKKQGVSLCILVDHKLPRAVRGDPKRIMHLVGNLIENAIRFTLKGEITVAIRAKMHDIESGKPCSIVVTCSDSGVGIPKAQLEAMVTELISDGDTESFKELGLGLRAVRNIAAQYSGNLSITSNEGQGTRVTVELELTVEEAKRQFTSLPKTFGFASTDKDVFVAIGKIGFFHGVRPIPVEHPADAPTGDLIFIDGQDLCLEKFGPLKKFTAKQRYVVLLRHDQLRSRERLTTEGFQRFLLLPLSSTSLLQCLVGEDVVTPAPLAGKTSAKTQKLRVLVVDDVATTRLRICDHIRSLGHVVEEGSDGIDLVERLNSGEHFDLVLCDLTMSHLDGIPAVAQVRAHEKSSNKTRTSIVAMTAYSVLEDTRSLVDMGFDAVLKKPVYLDEINYLLESTSSTKGEITQSTQIIDIEDLSRRTSGKTKIMAQVLESFIEASNAKLNELHTNARDSDVLVIAKSLHTLKGLLLEAGAKDSAENLRKVEVKLKNEQNISENDLSKVTALVQKACSEAANILKSFGSTREPDVLTPLVKTQTTQARE